MPSDTNLRVSMEFVDRMSPALKTLSRNAKTLETQFDQTAQAAQRMASAINGAMGAGAAGGAGGGGGISAGTGFIAGMQAAAKAVKTVVEDTKQSIQDLASVYYLLSKISDKAVDLTSKLTDTSDSIKLQKARLSAYNTSGFSDDVMYNVFFQAEDGIRDA